MDLSPSWSPDGGTLLWTSDRSGVLNVVAAEVDPAASRRGEVRMVTNVATGAGYPSVDPDGDWLYLSGYHVDGWEIERVPYRPEDWVRRATTHRCRRSCHVIGNPCTKRRS